MKWEYEIFTVKDSDNVMEHLNNIGADGWEVFHVHIAPGRSETFYCKRKVDK